MADFINTIDLLGDEVVAGMIVDGSITEFNDDALTTLKDGAFYGCKNLVSVNLPIATTMGSYAFQNCTNLKHIYGAKFTRLTQYCLFSTQKLKQLSIMVLLVSLKH